MTNFLKTARQEIGLQLSEAGLPTLEFIPERVVPPIAIIEPGTPYIEEGDTFTSFMIRFNVILLSGTWTNVKSTDTLDQMVVDAIDAIDTWSIERVDPPQAFEMNNQAYLGVRLALADHRHI